jgi:DNA-binding GntR family transcriptional regulator
MVPAQRRLVDLVKHSPPIERRNLSDEVYRVLWRMIVHRELEPGSKVAEEEVATALGVSRTPVREALHRLEYDGLLDTSPGQSSTVTPPTLEDLEEAYPVIAVLEGLAVRLAVPNLTDDDLQRLDELVGAMAEYGHRGEIEELTEVDTQFHRLIHERARNSRLQRIATDLRRQMERFEYTFFSSPAALEASLKRHRKLVEILRTHDPAAAQQALERQWDLGRQTLRQMLSAEAEQNNGLGARVRARAKSSESQKSSRLER